MALTKITADMTGDSIASIELSQLIKSANYTTVLADSGKHVLHPSADTTARTFTIPANSCSSLSYRFFQLRLLTRTLRVF